MFPILVMDVKISKAFNSYNYSGTVYFKILVKIFLKNSFKIYIFLICLVFCLFLMYNISSPMPPSKKRQNKIDSEWMNNKFGNAP